MEESWDGRGARKIIVAVYIPGVMDNDCSTKYISDEIHAICYTRQSSRIGVGI